MRTCLGRAVVLFLALLVAAGVVGVLGQGGVDTVEADTPAPTPPVAEVSASPAASTAAPEPSTAAPAPSEEPSQAPPPAAEGVVVPVVGVVDGDTLRVRVDGVTERVRIIGLDAPELSGDECLAQEAASRMQSLVQSRDVRIVADPTQDDRDVYDRLLRHVWTLDGRSVARDLIAEGLAREYTYDVPYDGVDEHRAAEAEAIEAALGIWGSACSSPAPAAPVAPQGQCDIKGNINREGERIYHVPGQRYYDDTRIDEGRGERWFCSEDEARQAGWRKAKV
jgi:micrococcal nuclease